MTAKVLSASRWRTWLNARREDACRVGAGNALKLAAAQALTILMKDARLFRARDGLWTLRTPLLRHPLHFRPFGSDLYVIRQILVEEEHASLRALPDVQFVVDCGANIGCAAAYFLSRFPRASLIAVEPEPANFELLRRNLAPYGPRATAIRAAVWSSNRSILRCAVGAAGDGLSWATRVEPAPEGQGDIPSVTVAELLGRSPVGRIDLLKIDIEGSETAVFGRGADAWLAHTRNLCIELHGAGCESAFHAAMSAFDHQRYPAGELVIAKNIWPKSDDAGPLPSPAASGVVK